MTKPGPSELTPTARPVPRDEQFWRLPDTVRDVLTVRSAQPGADDGPADPPAGRGSRGRRGAGGGLLAGVVAALPDAVVGLGPDGRVRLWNPAAADLFGWSAAEVTGLPPPFLPADREAEDRRMVALAAAGGRVRDVDTVRRAKGGALVRVVAAAAADSAGGVVLTFRRAGDPPAAGPGPDETRPGNVGQLETLGRLLTAVAHDVNNVLAVIAGHAELVARDLPDGSPARESAGVIRAAAGHAAELARRLLAFARPTDRPTGPADLSVVVAGLGPLVRAVAGAGVRVSLRPGRGVAAAADPTQVEQVVLNLVANARDAMPRGGTLGVRAGTAVVRPGRPGWPPHLPAGRYARLTVADTGTGIDDVTRARLFQPFFSTKGPAGSGVGLATVRDIVTRAGGHVEVDSDPGVGTVFRVYLPAAETAPPAGPAWVPTGTVLLADDHAPTRAAAKGVLEAAGFDVIEAASGDGAARLARAVPTAIDALVTELVLPGLGGRKLAAQLRAERPDLGVVFVSRYAPPADGEAFVAKPFRPAELLAAVRRVMLAVKA